MVTDAGWGLSCVYEIEEEEVAGDECLEEEIDDDEVCKVEVAFAALLVV